MQTAAVIFAAAAAVSVFLLIHLLRQIASIRRQLDFLKDNDSVMKITCDMPLRELKGLCRSLNDFLDRFRENKLTVEKNDAALRETIADLSHDIRTPLTSLDGYFRLLKDDPSPEERERYFKIIDSRITGLKNILDELFAYAKLQDGGFSPELSEVDLPKLAYDCAFSFYEDFVLAGIEPTLDIYEGRAFILADPDGLRRAAENVIKNALVHSVSRVNLSLSVSEGFAVLSCENDVPPDTDTDVERIFDRFYKADGSRASGSTGLGLSIAKALTESMGGEISAELTDETFSVKLRFPLLRNGN